MKIPSDLVESFRTAKDDYAQEAEAFWDGLTYEQKLFAFFAVTSRIHKGDIQEQGSYRHVIYGTFAFDEDAYVIGMWSGYMDIHNSIGEK